MVKKILAYTSVLILLSLLFLYSFDSNYQLNFTGKFVLITGITSFILLTIVIAAIFVIIKYVKF